VVDSRPVDPGDAIRRRRECHRCGARFTSYERVEDVPLMVRKRDGSREPFDRGKLLGGLLRAATKRPVQVQDLDGVVDTIAAAVRRGGGEADAERIGELALRGLISLDGVAAIRFASVYRRFEDLSEFAGELERIAAMGRPASDQLALEGAGPSDPEGMLGGPPSRSAGGAKNITRSPRRRTNAGHA